MAYIKTIKNGNDKTIYPQTITDAVFNADGDTLTEIIQAIYDAFASLGTAATMEVDNITTRATDENKIATTTVIPKFWRGFYTGDGTDNRLIELPFVAEHIEVSSSNIPEGGLTVGDINVYYIKSEMVGYTNETYTSYTHKMGGENYDYNSFTPNTMDISNWQNAQTAGYTGKGFKVSADLNISGATYSYLAVGFSTTD